jgi:aminopeptidase N
VLVGTNAATLHFAGCGAPVKANFGDAGYYRVEYDAGALKTLAASLPKLAPADRVDLLADQWALFVAGRAGLASYLDLTRKLAAETTLVVWSDVLAKLDAIKKLIRRTTAQAPFRRYALQLLRPALARTGWDATSGENNQTALLRAALISALGQYGDPAVIAECRRRFAAFLTQPASLAPNLRSSVIDTVGRYADQATFDKLRALGKASSGTEDKLRYYYALANAQNASFIDQNIKIALTDEIPNGRVNRFLMEVAVETNDPDQVWKTFLAQRAPILVKLPAGRGGALLAAIAEQSTDPAVARELLALPEAQASKGDRYEATKAVERIQEQSALKKRLLPPLAAWLPAH